jgi:formate--tetrahydrofolate ligase
MNELLKTDLEIANSVTLRPIEAIAEEAGFLPEELEPYGKYKAKVSLAAWDRLASKPDGKLILVTAMTPTKAGEGKTTQTIGLTQALCRQGKKAICATREPSLGPCFGMKGGAAGGGWSQVVPMEDINLHFTGDLHAVSAAHNLLAAMVDNHLHQGNPLGLDSRSILFPRVVDMNDRALRDLVIGLGSAQNGVPRQTAYQITTASEVMAILCLANGWADLRERLGRIIVGYSTKGEPVTAAQLQAHGAMAALLRDALQPNLVQTLEGTPAFVHGGPFANIAHGCSSLMATRFALKSADFVVTEAGFGADLGAEKFFDIKCPAGGLHPAGAVLVASLRAIKHHGNALTEQGASWQQVLKTGFQNLKKQFENVRVFGVPAVVAVNQFASDSLEEVEYLLELCHDHGMPAAPSELWAKGGAGGEALVEALTTELAANPANFRPLYHPDMSLKSKLGIIAHEIYGADRVVYTDAADKRIEQLEALGLNKLPICMAKTQYSLSDNPELLGAPRGFAIQVRDVKPSAGAGFVVAYTGDVMTMPGLPRRPAAESIDLAADGTILGLF